MLPQIKGLARDVSALKVGFRELDNLVKAIGECKSKAEEDRIILAELETLKQRLSDPKLDRSRGREYMVRVMYCEMLGHDASFAYIPCLQFASDTNLLTKKAAYLALTQLLDYKHELVLLLVNTLLSDLKSDNFVVCCSALVVTCKLIGPDLVNAVYPIVINRLTHPKEAVRKKAVMALHHFIRLDPHRTGPLQDHDVDKHLRTALCDKDPGVMVAALCALQEVAAINPAPYRALIPSLTSILKQARTFLRRAQLLVAEHRLPKSYDYHRFPAPFIQIKLLRVLAKLGAGDKAASDNMAAVVAGALKRASGGQTIGNAIIYEAVRTITAIYPSPQLLAAAAEAVTGLLRSSSHNLRYCGLDALAGITRTSPKYAMEHQVAVIDCLEDPDDTLKLKTLELLATMTKANNVQVIVERLMLYLKGCSDEHVRRDIATKTACVAMCCVYVSEALLTLPGSRGASVSG
ncbi:AP-4 complex subunit epsilon-1 [Monoraphidium neglectum]|uniref:AP-4 complex subunit epsilon-1 n=1 Tax=Monoraphidium neglectum TaxID=145388 RepID=A0A0D2M8M5_9CHLO|nr:AP-4 complex subunit epsilon-1 [Monoraphidium neglectum]KIY99624.1 AP-4 complex subunit epsilon-1 [Monoraphidium neglectum]|eukprot:XP_013898644.1 AP-4 complex subunit epsilon-1 [Monoraphidium neglectum]